MVVWGFGFIIYWLFDKWGCIGIRQDGLGSNDCNQVVALSHLRSVQRKLSAKNTTIEALAARLAARENAFSPVALAA